jgi:hypothetical protein
VTNRLPVQFSALIFMQHVQETGKISVTDYVRVTSTEWYYTH